MTLERSSIPAQDKWNVEALYPSVEEWEKDFKAFAGEEKKPRWPQLLAYRGKFGNGPKVVKEFIELYLTMSRKLGKLGTYTHLRHDEDVANDLHKQINERVSTIGQEFQEETAWIEPELLSLSDETLKKYLNSEELKDYKLYLERIIRYKPHVLSADKEELLASAGKALDSAHRAFGAFNNADLKFPPVVDSKGNSRELTHGKFLLYLRDNDRKLREESFKTVHRSYLAYENTLCELINGEIQTHVFNKRARNFPSCLEAALFPHKIDKSVYLSLIENVRKNLGSLHRYLKLRKKLLKVDELHLYDLHVPLVSSVDFTMSYDAAEKLVVEAVAKLGKEYQGYLDKGLKQDRWVDRYENQRKRSGAYSSGCYDSMPYILMNYHGTFNDVMTLTHEAGHSMHSLMSRKHQPYQYSQYPIFVAEVASTFHEELLVRHLLEKETDKAKKCYLINQKIDDIRGTFFRQTMFAEFELKLHTMAEEGVPITPALLKAEYRKLNMDYFGNEVVLDNEIDIEWARIPHFYYNFYVYQYATGISAAHALVDLVEKGDEKDRERYIKFLSSGCSDFPLELLKKAGVDMHTPQPVEALIGTFDHLVDELDKLMS